MGRKPQHRTTVFPAPNRAARGMGAPRRMRHSRTAKPRGTHMDGWLRRATVVTLALGGSLLAPSVPACSICRCGDPTYNALGNDGIGQEGWRLAVDGDRVEKTQGGGAEQESLTEQRATLLVAYGLTERLGAFLRVPVSRRELVSHEDGVTEHASATGLADPDLALQWRLWSSPFEGDVGTRSRVYLVGGVKTAWGENDARSADGRLDEHVQPGTGATDAFLGVAGSYQFDHATALVGSVQYRHTGRNDHDYRYGRSTLLNVAFDRRLGPRWDVVLEANYRQAGRDETDSLGTRDPDTGGSITYLTPRVLFDAGRGWVFRASAQLPLYQHGLNGEQHEGAVVNVGLTYLPPR